MHGLGGHVVMLGLGGHVVAYMLLMIGRHFTYPTFGCRVVGLGGATPPSALSL